MCLLNMVFCKNSFIVFLDPTLTFPFPHTSRGPITFLCQHLCKNCCNILIRHHFPVYRFVGNTKLVTHICSPRVLGNIKLTMYCTPFRAYTDIHGTSSNNAHSNFLRNYTKLTVLYNIDIEAYRNIPPNKVTSSGHRTTLHIFLTELTWHFLVNLRLLNCILLYSNALLILPKSFMSKRQLVVPTHCQISSVRKIFNYVKTRMEY